MPGRGLAYTAPTYVSRDPGLHFSDGLWWLAAFDIGHGICQMWSMDQERHVKLFRNGRNQAVRIPREFELPGTDAVMRKEGNRLIIEAEPPAKKHKLQEWLDTLEPIDDPFPEIDDPPPEPVEF